jgi:GTP-binding protein
VSETENFDEFIDETISDEEYIQELMQEIDESLPEHHAEKRLATVAIIGRPNVGKSTLVNRILGHREAVVEDKPGVTRDRIFYPAGWTGTDFLVIDTGGYESKAEGLSKSIREQVEFTIALADVVVIVIDISVGAQRDDELLIQLARRSNKPVILVANKVDDENKELSVGTLWNLGLGEPFAISALHGRGSGELLDKLVEVISKIDPQTLYSTNIPRISLVGKPNVGKSSLLNQLTGTERAIVHNVAGTTVDPIDEKVTLGSRDWMLVDTAGIRKRYTQAEGQEYYAVLRTNAAIERSDIVLMLIDGSEPISEQDQRILSFVEESGRALVLVINKWDLVDEDRRMYLEREIELDLAHVAWAPRINLSALTGRNVSKLAPILENVLSEWNKRISTGQLNQYIKEIAAAHPHPVRSGKQPRILFATQASTCPPRFILFATGFIEAGYRRFIVRKLREKFGFIGTPIQVGVRMRKRQ